MLSDCISLLRDWSTAPVLDIPSFINGLIFNVLIGNADAHGKNYSLLYSGGERRLSPYYDLVGFTLIGIDELDGGLTAYDAGTGIIPDFRGQGFARRMFDHALPELESRGVKRFLLEVLQGNKPGIKAYQKSGFEITREFRCFVAETASLKKLPSSAEIEVHSTDAATFESLVPEAEWTPSFENRFTAHLAIPDHVTFLGAYDGNECIGATVYCQALNWLLALLVKRSYRCLGVGTSLLQHLATTMPETASKLAALNVDGQDTGMQAFFAAIGFSHLIDQYEMSRRL